MTLDEFKTLKFNCAGHVSAKDYHTATYINYDYGIKIINECKMRDGEPYGRGKKRYIYRGEVMFKYKPIPSRFKPQHTVDISRIKEFAYEIGDRIGQIVIIPYPQIELEEVEELSETERGTKGYGSTGE